MLDAPLYYDKVLSMNWDTPANKQLVEAFLGLKTPAEARRFFRDLMTEGEIAEFGKRLEAARLLSKKESYPVIQKATGFSTTTIARVSKWLASGKGGYRLVLNRLHTHTIPAGGRGVR